ncbi:MAG: esterase/lipase family protein [Sandaracinaceae bacterium]
MSAPHRIYLIPGMFGFGRLAGYDYFVHLRRALAQRFDAAGVSVVVEAIPVQPTASIRRRAVRVARAITSSSEADDGPIHLVGHSTGGLDARLLMSPTTNLGALDADQLAWRRRVRSLVTMNTPHFGTPLAAFFATVSGTRLLYAISLLTVTTLSVGRPGLAALAKLVAALGAVDDMVGVNVRLLDEATTLTLRFVGEQGQGEVREWLAGIREDQGGIIQLMPEAMDLFNAAAEDDSAIRYACVATASPPPGPVRFVSSVRSPYSALSATVYSTIYTLTSSEPSRYPYPAPERTVEARLSQTIGRPSTPSMSDGVVPLRSMLWGELLYSARADHLDVVGHFSGEIGSSHTDWLSSGAHFDSAQFDAMADALAHYLLSD